MVRSGKKLIGQANSQTLSNQMSCKVSPTFANTVNYEDGELDQSSIFPLLDED